MAIAGSLERITANEIVAGTITDDKLATPGKILQVVNSIKTDTLSSAGAGAWNDIGLSVAITPSSTSSKIFVSV